MPDRTYDSPLVIDPLTDEGDRLRVSEEGKGYIQVPDTFPSLSGATPRYGVSKAAPETYGMAGTVSANPASRAVSIKTRALAKTQKDPTPEELMAMAIKMQAEQELMYKNQLEKPPAVQDALERSGSAPDWLRSYMEKQAFTDPYHQPGRPDKVDAIRKNKYLTKEEKDEYLKRML